MVTHKGDGHVRIISDESMGAQVPGKIVKLLELIVLNAQAGQRREESPQLLSLRSCPRETMKPESTDYASVQSPKRQVSTQLVAQGKEFLDKKDYDHARGRLEEAVSVDPTNGAAYYQLAVVYYNLHDFPKALGFLDQAETLLHTSPEWMETIQRFREQMH